MCRFDKGAGGDAHWSRTYFSKPIDYSFVHHLVQLNFLPVVYVAVHIFLVVVVVVVVVVVFPSLSSDIAVRFLSLKYRQRRSECMCV